jgi:hypothetical protein
MNLHAAAVRDSTRKGLTGEAFEQNVKNILDNPPDTIHFDAKDAANVHTYTNRLEGALASAADIINTVPGLKIIAPFFRVNANLTMYALERTPLAPILSNVRADLAAGGARADLAMAKIAFGSSMMATAGALAYNGVITGSGPKNPDAKKALELTGWKPNSVKIGNTYYSYDRIDPFGMLLGMAADFAEFAGELADDRPDDLANVALAMAATTVDQMTPEVLTESMADFLKIVQGDEKFFSQYASNLAGSAVPFSGLLKTFRKGIDPVRREVNPDSESKQKHIDLMINSIKNSIPGLSETLPARLNMFGEPLLYGPGLGPDMISPIASSEETTSPIRKEIVRLGLAGKTMSTQRNPSESDLRITMPPKVLDFGNQDFPIPIKLTHEEYNQYVKLSAGVGLRGAPGTLEEVLNAELKAGFNKVGKLSEQDQVRRVVIKKIIGEFKKGAKAQLVRDNEGLRERIKLTQERGLEFITGGEDR